MLAPKDGITLILLQRDKQGRIKVLASWEEWVWAKNFTTTKHDFWHITNINNLTKHKQKFSTTSLLIKYMLMVHFIFYQPLWLYICSSFCSKFCLQNQEEIPYISSSTLYPSISTGNVSWILITMSPCHFLHILSISILFLHRNFVPVAGIHLSLNIIIFSDLSLAERFPFEAIIFLSQEFFENNTHLWFFLMRESAWFNTKFYCENSTFPVKILPTFPGNISPWRQHLFILIFFYYNNIITFLSLQIILCISDIPHW